MKNTVLTAVLIAAALGANAQAPALVSDIQPGTGSSYPATFTPFNGKLYMNADDGVNGRELWMYTGVAAPTLAYNLNPSMGDGAYGDHSLPMVVVGSTMYFAGDNGSTGTELYQYTGSGAPTLAYEMESGVSGSGPDWLTVLGGKIYYSAYSSTGGSELWIYDPATGSAVTQDVNPGSESSYPGDLAVFNNKLYFTASNGTAGTELMQYNPATNTVSLVQDIESGSAGSDPKGMVAVGSELYFFAVTTTYGYELYRYNGAMVTRLTDVGAGSISGLYAYDPRAIGVYNGDIYFPGSTDGGSVTQLYKYATATGTTSLVYTLNGSGDGRPYGFTEYNGKLYFSATDGTNGTELWMHDGTNTAMVANLNPGSASSVPNELCVWSGSLYLSMNDGVNGFELFKLTTAGSGIASIAFDGELSAFPNPATDVCTVAITLKQSQAARLTLADVAGREVFSTGAQAMPAGKTTIDLPVRNLAAGNYCYTLRDEAGRIMASGKITRQ